MKRILVIAGIVSMMFSTQLVAQSTVLKVGDKAPELKMASPDGKEIALSDLKGQVVLIDFWAAWCGPCIAMGPVIDSLAEEFEGRAKIGKVNCDEEKGLATEYGISAIPAILIFKGGEVVETLVGVQPEVVLRTKLENLIE